MGIFNKHYTYNLLLTKFINRNQTPSWSYTFASFLVLKRIRKALGFDRCDLFVSAAAPISNEVVKYFMSLDIPLMEVFHIKIIKRKEPLS
jgi:long-subunit acyl-CoA synthetase (AMP-forming)